MTTPRALGNDVRAYWRRVHARVPHVDPAADPELLDVVCHGDAPAWYNRYHARVQASAFEDALVHVGPLRGKQVLEIGCGSGRWSRLLAERGAEVLAVDLSPELIDRNRREIPDVRFEVADVLELELTPESIDLAVSVTVIQHLPPHEQEVVAAKLAGFVRSGGAALLLENTRDHGAHVFARTVDAWLELFERHGFRLVWTRAYAYDVALRAADAVVRAIRRAPAPPAANGDAPTLGLQPGSALARAYWQLVRRPLTLASYGLEPVLERALPDFAATHAAFVLQRA